MNPLLLKIHSSVRIQAPHSGVDHTFIVVNELTKVNPLQRRNKVTTNVVTTDDATDDTANADCGNTDNQPVAVALAPPPNITFLDCTKKI